jgi:chromosome condensin MukBEF complex kleisin-like MukF subunit
MVEEDGQLHTLGLLEQLRDQCESLWGTSSELYFRVDKLLQQLANPNLHDILSNLQIHVELWDRYDKHIRWVIRKSVCCCGRAFV